MKKMALGILGDGSLIDPAPFDLVLSSHQTNEELKFAEWSVYLDQKIYLEFQKFDAVCVAVSDDITADVLASLPDKMDNNTVYYISHDIHTSSFFCAPHLFSELSGLYKLNFAQYKFKNLDTCDPVTLLTEKIFYLINRLGMNYKRAQD
jgi:hypothetical protein